MGNRIRIKQIDLQGVISASGQIDLLSASNYVSFVNELNTTMSSDAELAAVSSSISQSIYILSQNAFSRDGLISGSQQITDLGFISTSTDIADFTFSEQTISNSNIVLNAYNDITLQTENGNIVLNPDGNAYIGSANAGNGIVTDGFLAGIIGDTNTVNNSTGHTLTDD